MLNYSFALSLLMLLGTGYLYDKYKNKIEKMDKIDHDDIVRRYLLNEETFSEDKPIIWIHVENEINAIHWKSFGSRNTKGLNQPYKHFTIQSIIKHSSDKYNICMIDDESFSKLLPQWNIDINSLADPIKSNIRTLALFKLLYTYGGFLIPSSYHSLKPIKNLYNMGLDKSDCFILEGRNNAHTSKYFNIYPSHLFIGCHKSSSSMKELIAYLEILCSKDHTSESQFLGDINNKCNDMVGKGSITLIDGSYIGIKDKHNNHVMIEELLSSGYIQYNNSNLQGILIPDKEILKRSKYQWFSRLSKTQIYNSDIILCKYLQA